MSFELWNSSAQLSQFIVLLIFTPLGIAVTVLRFVATYRGARKPSLEDWLAVAATIFFILTNLAALMAITLLNGREITTEVFQNPPNAQRVRKWDMAGLYFYFAQTLAVKLSVLALYFRLFRVNRAYRIWIYLLGAAQTILFFVFCVFQALQCRPISKYFDLRLPGSCKDEGTVILGGEVPNSLVDFAMVILAMFMIRPLQLSSAMKWRLRLLFGLGALVGIIGFIKIAITYSASTLYAFSMISLWSCVQMFVSLLCCCLPVFRPILPTAAFWSRLSSRMISYATFGRVSRDRTTANSARGSSKNSRGDSAGQHGLQGWKYLNEDNSMKALAWPEATHQAETHALSEFPIQGTHLEYPGIQVERRFDVV
ncbi:hypothetical protein F4677DRAFT_449744 [Hypoxylon crocopeplum]|nr:hypothetical protein F4677DRAFT_449744 [Hypoxylon crocopeplum]